MRNAYASFLLLVAGLGLAGCLTESPPVTNPGDPPLDPKPLFEPFTVPAPSFDFSKIVDPDHLGHEVAKLHTANHGLKTVGQTGIGSILPPGMRGSITQIDIWNDYAVVPGMEQGPAFVIVDVSDPAHPKPVSYAPTMADGWTARFSKDGEYVFYGCQVLGAPNSAPQGVVRGSCEDPNEIHGQTSTPGGISVWDVKDKKSPKFVDFLAAAGSHNLQTQWINETDYVFTSSTAILKFDRATGTLSQVAKVPGVHDATVVKHPITHDWLLHTGGANDTFATYNVNVPEEPEIVLAPSTFKEAIGWHDQVAFPEAVDGRALLAVAGETGINPTGGVPNSISLIDITDPAKPALLSTWKPPFGGRVMWNSYTFSAHEMAATPQGQLAVSWYHGGVWVLDVSTKERQATPVTVAAFQPSLDINVIPSTFGQTPVPLVPFAWSVAWDQRGYLVVPDMHTGVYVLEPEWGLRPLLDSGA